MDTLWLEEADTCQASPATLGLSSIIVSEPMRWHFPLCKSQTGVCSIPRLSVPVLTSTAFHVPDKKSASPHVDSAGAGQGSRGVSGNENVGKSFSAPSGRESPSVPDRQRWDTILTCPKNVTLQPIYRETPRVSLILKARTLQGMSSSPPLYFSCLL